MKKKKTKLFPEKVEFFYLTNKELVIVQYAVIVPVILSSFIIPDNRFVQKSKYQYKMVAKTKSH